MPQKIFSTKLTDVIVSTTATPRVPKDALGNLRWEGNQCYKRVQLVNATATVVVAANDPIAYAAATGHSTNTVVSDNNDADGVEMLAGIALATIAGVHTGGTTYFIWIKIKGTATINQAISGSADGQVVMMSSTDLTLEVRANPEEPCYAVSQDESAKILILNCPF